MDKDHVLPCPLTKKLCKCLPWIAVIRIRKVFEPVRHAAIGVSVVSLTTRASFQSLLAELVVDLSLPGITQHVVGLADLLKLLLGPGGLVLVRVILQGQLPVGFLELVVAGTFGNTKDGVIIFPHADPTVK